MDIKIICSPKVTLTSLIAIRVTSFRNIRGNLSQVLQDESIIDAAMEKIFQNRETVTSYKLTKPKK